MNAIEELKERVISHDMLCDEYRGVWDNCKSRKQLFDMAGSMQGSATLCHSIAEGWGLSVNYICDKFQSYINDNCISEHKEGYTSKIYCRATDMVANATNVVVIECDGVIRIPSNMICEIKMVNSDCRIVGDDSCSCFVIKYGDCNVVFDGDIKYHIKNGL